MAKKKSQADRANNDYRHNKISSPGIDKAPFVHLSEALMMLCLSVLVALVYENALEGPFVFDDKRGIEDNSSIRLNNLTLEGITEAGFKSPSSSRPIANISFALNYYFHQYQVMGYHVVNIVVHIATGILLYLFAKATLRMPPVRARYGRYRWIPFFAAFIWLVHPLHTQSVTYSIQRMNSMAAMFYLLSFLFYIKGRNAMQGIEKLGTGGSQSEIRNPKSEIRMCYFWFAGSVLAWLLAMGSKQIAATVPFFIFVYEWYFFQDMSRKWLKRQAKYLVGVGVLLGVLVFVYLGMNPWETITGKYTDLEYSFGERVLTEFRVVVYYLSLLVYPHPSRLNLDYDYPVSHSLFEPISTIVCIGGVLGLIGYGIYAGKRERLVSFCILWFFGNLVIESLIPRGLIYEHRTYLPSMLVMVMVVALGYRYIRAKAAVVTGLCIAGVLSSYWTHERNKVWGDDVTLWKDCVAKSPRKARPHNNLGSALERRGRSEDAIKSFSEALRIHPDYPEAHNNLGVVFYRQGDLQEAIHHYRDALQIDPDYADAQINLGNALSDLGDVKGAIWHYTEALRIESENAEAHNNLGSAQLSQGNATEAIEHFFEALRINPFYGEVYNNLGSALELQGNAKEAMQHYTEALRLKPDFAEAHNNLGSALEREGRFKEAMSHFSMALEIDRDYAEAHYNMGVVFLRQGKFDEALPHLSEAVRIKPDYAEAHYNMGVIAFNQENFDKAMRHYSAALEHKPEYAEAYYNMGLIAFAQGSLTDAIHYFSEAVRIAPDHARAHYSLGVILSGEGKLKEASFHLSETLRIQPNSADAHVKLGTVLERQGSVHEAISHYSEALKINPNLQKARRRMKALSRKGDKAGRTSDGAAIQ